ncbi:hypothetical protein [Macellibacteroides fermentans]|jgi:hypothetical protein|uniref:hypothetical protein n=1 Tax=Macellibacteroides fermentans TaxID=879969 RepID=UPI00082F33E1|nr:hypothetical protein [Parabacteroides sp.]MDT3369461.1 hypothetical protein [Bacteroidota bacterium]OCW95604.1 hypothetical protein A9168_02825 [Macellibacteroides sp. HH-ZS]OJV42748.1 MAG: hypothetical protein BGO29_01385 [Bacteroidales bacterium 36-12]HML69858.1 hypothetical protein [Macellibacteroides fermentans]
MRRLGLVFSAIVLVATMSFGQSKKVNLVSDINFEKLSNYLQLKPSQMNEVASINEFFSEQLAEASRASESRYDKKVHQAVYSNLKLMKGTLSEDQYRKYLTLINVTNNNNRLFSAGYGDTYLAEVNE